MQEKRKTSRTQKKLKSEVHSASGMTFSNTADLSQGGIFITTPEPLKSGDHVELQLYIPGEQPVNIQGIIRWTRNDDAPDKKTGMGIEFTKMSNDSLKLLKKVL